MRYVPLPPHKEIPNEAVEHLKALVWRDRPYAVRFGWDPLPLPSQESRQAASMLSRVEDSSRRAWLREVFEDVGLAGLKTALGESDG